MVKKKNEGAIVMTAMLLISLFVSTAPIGTADEGDTHNIIDEIGTTGFMVLIGQKLNFTGDVPAGVPIIGVLPEDIEGDVFGVTSNNYDTEAFMSTWGVYWIDIDCDGIGGNPAGYDWRDDDDTYLHVDDPHLHLDLKVQWKSVESIQQGTNLIIDFDTNLADTDTVDLKITDPNGSILTGNPTNADQTFDDINISYLQTHYGYWSSPAITTDGWQLGNYTFQIITESNMARGLYACSSTRMLEICQSEITIEADKTSVPPFEYVLLTVKGAQFHKITVNSSNHEHTIFPPRVNDNPYYPPSLPFNDTLRSGDGIKDYVVYFERPGVYTISVSDVDVSLQDSIDISVTDEEYIHIGITKEGYPEYWPWVSEVEQVNLSVIGKPNHKVKITTSCPSETDFELGKYDYTTTTQNLDGFVESIWENGINDSIDDDGEREYALHFKEPGCYKMTVYDMNVTIEDSVNISVSYSGTEHEDNPERKQDAWTLNTVFIGESLNITGLDPFSYVIFEKTTEPFDQYFINVDSDGCAIMESWDTLFIGEGGYNMSFVREGMSWEDREHKIVYFVEPKLTIDITDVEGKKIESVEQGQSIMIDTGGGTSLPEDDVLAIEINGNDCRWIVCELSLSELGDYQIDTTCWMPGIYSINAETIEEKSRGLRICSNWVDLEVLPTTKPEAEAFDTGASLNPYPSIMGTHNGTITLDQTITISELYTYPCSGTGGHTEYVKLWNSTGWNVTATWNGYTGDWHNISFNETFMLYKNETYNCTIRTGSYPQIHHNRTLLTENGWINCTEFTDANGKRYNNWIPAIRLE